MNDIPVTNIIAVDNPQEYKFHAARLAEGVQPLDAYVQNKDEWLNWNRWRGTKNEFNRKYIFSLMDFYHESDMWLFGGIYEVLSSSEKPNDRSYEIAELKQYACYTGRLKISLPRPSRGRAFYLENHLDKMQVAEILKQPYSGEVFPGYENINHAFSMLVPIFKNQNPDWKAALENVKGVYVITDISNSKRYVGAAYGSDGIWSRWDCYMGTGHGWNDELTKIIAQQGIEYATSNFSLSLLEYRSMKTDDHVIIEREAFWKELLLSRRGAFGYNKN